MNWLLRRSRNVVSSSTIANLVAILAFGLVTADTALAGGPKFVAGTSYFNQAVVGQPVVWANGQVNYYVDQGPLSALVSNQQARAMVDAAAAVWDAVPTAAVTLKDMGNLAENVDQANVVAANGVFEQPADLTPAAVGTPVGVVFDADGSVVNALLGANASEPDNCATNGVLVWIDNINPNATFAHGVIVLNGLCATSPGLIQMMSFQLERAFGRILGLDYSQVNLSAAAEAAMPANGPLGWPVMLPVTGTCAAKGGACIPNPGALRLDDIAALNRMYPVTAANQGGFPGSLLTAANTVSIQGTVSFRNGVGMQGVNVVATPLDATGNPLSQYAVSFVSGGYFAGNHGNPVTGWNDALGNPLSQYGSANPALQGFFDLSGIPLPPGVTMASYRVTFEPVNPAFFGTDSVGPYVQGSPEPSGTMPVFTENYLTAGSAQTLTATVANSASGPVATAANASTVQASQQAWGVKPLPASGAWTSRLNTIGQTDWFALPVRGNRIFTVVTQALDETGTPTAAKAMPALGVWDGFDLVGSAAVGFAGANNGLVTGETWLQVATQGNDVVRLGVADQRGDGRPDYMYRGWVLYADTVSPARLPAAGGMITIRGMGFHAGDTVTVGGVAAAVVGILPNEITALVPAAAGKTGSQDVTVSDAANLTAVATIPGGLSYDSGNGDLIGIRTAPMGQVPTQVPQAFSVAVLGSNNLPASGVTVTYTVTGGTAALGCGQRTCAVTATGDGLATMPVTATNAQLAIVTAALTNGASIQAQFYGVAPPVVSSMTPVLHLAAGATASWPVQAVVLSGGNPVAGEMVGWQSRAGIGASGNVATSAAGVASATLAVGPMAEGQTATTQACLTGGASCASFSVLGARPEYGWLGAVSGTKQSLPVSGTPAPVAMRVLDMDGYPLVAATVTVHEALYAWTPACPPHGRCAQPKLLATQALTLTAGLDGSVTFTPLGQAGVATNLVGVAATGNASSLSFAVEMHP